MIYNDFVNLTEVTNVAKHSVFLAKIIKNKQYLAIFGEIIKKNMDNVGV